MATERLSDPTEKKWYAAIVGSSHVGAGREDEHVNYIYATDALDALDRLYKMRGWKRHRASSFPSVREMTPEEVIGLEAKVSATHGVTLKKAQEAGFYGIRKT